MILRSLKTGGSERVTLILENGEEIASTLGVITELRLYAGKDLTDAELKLLRCFCPSGRIRRRSCTISWYGKAKAPRLRKPPSRGLQTTGIWMMPHMPLRLSGTIHRRATGPSASAASFTAAVCRGSCGKRRCKRHPNPAIRSPVFCEAA